MRPQAAAWSGLSASFFMSNARSLRVNFHNDVRDAECASNDEFWDADRVAFLVRICLSHGNNSNERVFGSFV
jgi:hypothetical protein